VSSKSKRDAAPSAMPSHASASADAASSRKPFLRLVRDDDREFLPAALEILDTPPSPARVFVLMTICCFVAAALIWSYVGRLDIIATATGKVALAGDVKVVQPLETSSVTQILAKNGQEVAAGEVLIRLDSREAQADADAASVALAAYEAERVRRLAALGALRSNDLTPPRIDWPALTPKDLRIREESVLADDLRSLSSQIASLDAQAAQKEAEQAGLRAEMQAQTNLVDTDQTRVDMRSRLAQTGAGSKADLVNADETLQYQQVALAQEAVEFAQSQAAERVVFRNIAEARSKFAADNAEKLDDAERQIDDLQQKLAKARAAVDHMTLRSPIDGTVQGLTVTTVGQVLTPGEEAMRIVPRLSHLQIEAYLPDEDRGFVKVGDEAVVKVASFPFTRYGTLKARVAILAQDAVPEADATQQESDPFRPREETISGGSEPVQKLVYPMMLRLERTSLNVDGAKIPIDSGMSVTVEIRTGSRRILEYIFSPLVQTASEAMKER
jgi:hemolysin D